eukprot:gene4183-5161_t
MAKWLQAPTSISMSLGEAAARGQTERILELVRQGADVQGEDGIGLTAIHAAALNDQAHVISVLVGLGADLEARCHAIGGFEGSTALHIAAKLGHSEVVRALIELDADTHAEDGVGYTPPIRRVEGKGTETSSKRMEAKIYFRDAVRMRKVMGEVLKHDGSPASSSATASKRTSLRENVKAEVGSDKQQLAAKPDSDHASGATAAQRLQTAKRLARRKEKDLKKAAEKGQRRRSLTDVRTAQQDTDRQQNSLRKDSAVIETVAAGANTRSGGIKAAPVGDRWVAGPEGPVRVGSSEMLSGTPRRKSSAGLPKCEGVQEEDEEEGVQHVEGDVCLELESQVQALRQAVEAAQAGTSLQQDDMPLPAITQKDLESTTQTLKKSMEAQSCEHQVLEAEAAGVLDSEDNLIDCVEAEAAGVPDSEDNLIDCAVA